MRISLLLLLCSIATKVALAQTASTLQQIMVSCDDVCYKTDPTTGLSSYEGVVDNIEVKWRPAEGYIVTEHIRTRIGEENKTTERKADYRIPAVLIRELETALNDSSLLVANNYMRLKTEAVGYRIKDTQLDIQSRIMAEKLMALPLKVWKKAARSCGLSRKEVKKFIADYQKLGEVESFVKSQLQQPKFRDIPQGDAVYKSYKIALVTKHDTLILVANEANVHQSMWQIYTVSGEMKQLVFLPNFSETLQAILPARFTGRVSLDKEEVLCEYILHCY